MTAVVVAKIVEVARDKKLRSGRPLPQGAARTVPGRSRRPRAHRSCRHINAFVATSMMHFAFWLLLLRRLCLAVHAASPKSFTPVLSAQFILCAHQQPPPCCRQIGAGAIDVKGQRRKRGPKGAPRKLGVGPGANLIESFASGRAPAASRGDPHDQIGTLGL